MRGPDEQISGMFSYLSPEQRVRPDHPLRAIRRLTDEALATLSPAPEGLLAQAIAEVRSILSGPTIQARCLECPPVGAAPRLSADDRSWLVRLLSWS